MTRFGVLAVPEAFSRPRWQTEDGTFVPVDTMTDEHLTSAIRMLDRMREFGSPRARVLTAEAKRRRRKAAREVRHEMFNMFLFGGVQ